MGLLRSWSNVPQDRKFARGTREFLEWARTSAQALVGPLTPLPAPTVSAFGLAAAVGLRWDEIPGAAVYAIYEAELEGEISQPFATVKAREGKATNFVVRSGLNDTTTRFYYVRAYSALGIEGELSAGVAQAPGSSLDTTGLSSSLISINIDSSLGIFREDFVSGTLTGGTIGWMNLLGSVKSIRPGFFPHVGILRLGLDQGSGYSGAAVGMSGSGMGVPWNQLGNMHLNPYWHFVFIARAVIPSGGTASTVGWRTGFYNSDANDNPDLLSRFQFRFTPPTDASLKFTIKGNSGSEVVYTLRLSATDSPLVPSDNQFHRYEMICGKNNQGQNVIRLYFDGTLLYNDENLLDHFAIPFPPSGVTNFQGPFKWRCVSQTTTPNTYGRAFDVDYVSFGYDQQSQADPAQPRWFATDPG